MRNILKQTSWLFFAQAITRGIGFFYTIFLAKNLGVEEFGLFSLGLAYFSIISSLADFGFNRFLIREIAKEKAESWEIVWNVLILRLTLVSLLFAGFSLFTYTFDQNKMRVSIILLGTLAVLPTIIAMTFDGIFIALQKLQFSAVSAFVSSIATVFIGIFLVSRGFGALGAVNALILGQFIYALVLLYFVYKKHGVSLAQVTTAVLKKAILGSLPYGLLGILGLLYFRVDIILLSYIKGSFETGIYGAAYRFLESITFIPSAFSLAIFPILSKLHTCDIHQARKLYFRSLRIMGVLGIIVFLGYILILPKIVSIFLPNYLSSIQAISILAVSIPFMFAHVPAVSVLLSTDKYLKQVILLSIFTLVFNIIANLIFIPGFGFIAASWVTVFSEVLSFIIFFLFTKEKVLK